MGRCPGRRGHLQPVVMLMTLVRYVGTSPASLGRKDVRCLRHRSLHDDGNYKEKSGCG